MWRRTYPTVRKTIVVQTIIVIRTRFEWRTESVPFQTEEERRNLDDIGEMKEEEETGKRSDVLEGLDRSS